MCEAWHKSGSFNICEESHRAAGGGCLRSWRPKQVPWPVLSASYTFLSIRVSLRKGEARRALGASCIWGSSLCTQENLLSQLDMESQWFTTSPFLRLTSPEHSVFRKQNMWLPLKAVVTTFCAWGECSKKCKGSSQEGPAGTGEGRWEQPQLSWRVMLLAWDGLGHLVSPVWGLWCFPGPNTMRQVSVIRHSGLWR